MRSLQDLARSWNATPEEREAAYPCDAYAPPAREELFRAIDVAAPAPTTFRWLCQLKVAPYSYDWIDNRGRRSPASLTPGVDHLEVGQRFLVFDLVEFEPGRHLTGVSYPSATRMFGSLAGSYVVTATGPTSARLTVKLCVDARGPVNRLRATMLGWGDLVMMSKQLRTLKARAESRAAKD